MNMSLIYKGNIMTGNVSINDEIISYKNLWSSEKINEKINEFINSGVLIDDENSATNKVYSSYKINELIGDLTTLETTEKSNLVNAINEAKEKGFIEIDDTTLSETSVYSSQKVESLISYTLSYSNDDAILKINIR